MVLDNETKWGRRGRLAEEYGRMGGENIPGVSGRIDSFGRLVGVTKADG